MHQPLPHEEGVLILRESLWYMLSGGAQHKEAEKNIIQHLKKLCRMNKIPVSKSKDVMLRAIQSNKKASSVLVASYNEWVKLNSRVHEQGDEAAPCVVAMPVGSVGHKCNS